MASDSPAERPSVFLSYASEDRPVVRKLRDALAAAGIDAWYDENELTGGDAWDAKIRRQIRECTYFMPVISRQASARLEGYFRREWRFALERTLDMADDVVFLLPVVIDDISETAARVPEKFFAVQWLRVPGGNPTPTFHELARRLASGGAQRLHHAPSTPGTRAPMSVREPVYLPPLNQEPSASENGGSGRSPWRFWTRIPRWIQVVVVVTVALILLDRFTSNSQHNSSAARKQAADTQKSTAAPDKAMIQRALETAKSARPNGTKQAARSGQDLAFVLAGPAPVQRLLTDLYGKFVTVNDVSLHLSPMPLKEGETALSRAAAAKARLLLSGSVVQEAGRDVLRVQLQQTAGGGVVWSGDFPVADSTALISSQVFAQVMPHVLRPEAGAAK